MTEWGVFGVIVALVGLLATVTAPLIKLNGNITHLNVTLDQMLSLIHISEPTRP